jgi:S1-C subfamily serine protease
VADWQTKLKMLGGDATNARALALVCAASIAAPGGADGKPKPAPFSSGSGIFVNGDGLVLTNAHVVRDCKSIIVKVLNVPPVAGIVDTVDPTNDLALVRTRQGYGVAATFRAEKRPAQLGEGVGVIGYPLTGTLSSEPKATFGQVSSVAGMNNDYTKLQISAPIQPGNSGGPVFDQRGQVIGVVVSTASTALMANIGMVTQNVNFAIRGEIAQIFMNAHGIRFRTSNSDYAIETAQIAEAGQRSTAQILCLKQ